MLPKVEADQLENLTLALALTTLTLILTIYSSIQGRGRPV